MVVKRTPMDKMKVSRAVASLEAKGFVLRAISNSDRRVNTLSLSKAGRALFDRIAAVALDYEDNLLSALDENERALFDRLLIKLEERVREDE